MKKLTTSAGYTLLELIIALVLSGIMATAGFEFYTAMHNQTLVQEEISDMQQNVRASLDEMVSTVRMAGFKVGAHSAYQITGDSLWVFYNDTQPIDTVLYFLEAYAGVDTNRVAMLPTNLRPRKLMKKVNSGNPQLFSDMVSSVTFTAPSTDEILIQVEVQPSKPDEDYNFNQGVRTLTFTERVVIRNLS